MPAAPRLEAITARGRARRHRRLGGLSVAAAGACAALVAGLAGGSGSAGPAPQHQSPPAQLAAFSVVTGPDGTTTLTLYPGQVANPDAVRRALAELAEELLAEAFTRAWTSWGKVRRHAAPRAWVVRTALNRPSRSRQQ